jgi:transposase-like protein
MTLFSVTDCCRQLGIDAKTLHRWLGQAHLGLQAHPTDARLKGLTGEHLRRLASTHHRSLAFLPEEVPVPAPSEPPLPLEFLALLSKLAELPVQMAALQQQLSALTQLLQQPAGLSLPGPVVAAEPAVIPAAAGSRPVAVRAPKSPPKPAHVLACVEYVRAGHYVVLCPTHGLLPFEPESPAWFAWLATRCSFRFVGQAGRFTAHREGERLPNAVWRAHRKIRNHTYNQRLAHTPTLTISVLEQAAATLQAHLK